ncbi:MAG: hypothetical protein QXX09_05545 [Candidatus Methanomethylicia archaeon]
MMRYPYISVALLVLITIGNYFASYSFSLLNPLASYIGQSIILVTTIGLVLALKGSMENKLSYSSFISITYVYIISISSWHIFLTNHSFSPDVNFETTIVEEITKSGYIGNPQKYYYAAKLYAEFPATELLASFLSIALNCYPYIIMNYLWIFIKSILILFLFLFFKRMGMTRPNKEIKYEETILFSTISSLFVLSSSSSIYFFSFTIHNLTSLTLLMMTLYFYTRNESRLGMLVVIATLIISHNATLIVFIAWMILLLILKIADHDYNRIIIELSSLTLSIVYFLYISYLNFNNIINTLEYLIQEPTQLHLQTALTASISPIKPFYYKILGLIHVFLLVVGALYGVLLSLNRRMFPRAFNPWLSLLFFSIIYFIILTFVPLLVGRGLDVLVRARLPLALITAVPLTKILARLLRNGSIWRGVALVVFSLYLIGGFYDLVPPAVYDKHVQYSMDDPRYSIMLEEQFDVLRYFLLRNDGRPIYSIALGYHYIASFGISYIPITPSSLLDIENKKSEFVAVFRWDLQKVPDYEGVSVDVNSILRITDIIFNSKYLYVVIN